MKNLAQTILIIVVISTTIMLATCSQSDKPATVVNPIQMGDIQTIGREVTAPIKANPNKAQHPLVYKLWCYADGYDRIENVNPWSVEHIGSVDTLGTFAIPNWVQPGNRITFWSELVGESIGGITYYYDEDDYVKSEPNFFVHHIDSSQYITPFPRIEFIKKLDSNNPTAQEFEVKYSLARFSQGIYKDCMLVARFGFWPEGATESSKTYCPEFTILSGMVDTAFVSLPNSSRTADTKLWLVISYAQTQSGIKIPMRTRDGAIMPLGVCGSSANLP